MLSETLQNALKHFRYYDLIVIADKLSENSGKWNFSGKSIGVIVEAISENVDDETLMLTLEKLWGTNVYSKVYHDEIPFPPAHQFGKTIIGPLGIFKTRTQRKKYDGIQTVEVLSYIKELTALVESLKGIIPTEMYSKIYEGKGNPRFRAIQAILAYADDNAICDKTNELVNEGKIKIEIPHLFEMKDQFSNFAITRYGLINRERRDPVENLRGLLLSRLTEEQLAPELRYYKGDYPTKLLEYCIRHDPPKILASLFGLPALREIASQWKLNIGLSTDSKEVATLILLKLGFNVPPELEGIEAYVRRVEQNESEFMAVSDIESRAAAMTRLYVEIERVLKDMVNFYIGFLWQNEVSEVSEKDDINKILIKKVLKPTKKLKPVDRLTLGDLIHVLRYIRKIAGKNRKLSSRVKNVLERTVIMPDRSIDILDNISPYRKCFTHPEEYPGSDACRKIFDLAKEFGEILKHDSVYPIALRITREIDDSYGRRYAEGIDESGHPWTIYTRRYLMPEKPYLMFSRTNPIAIDPVLVQKI